MREQYPVDNSFCWCNSGTLMVTGRIWPGVPAPHAHDPHGHPLTDAQWALAMRQTPHAAALTEERRAAAAGSR